MSTDNTGTAAIDLFADDSSDTYIMTPEVLAELPIVLYNAPSVVRQSRDHDLRDAYRKAAPALYQRRSEITQLADIIDHFSQYGISTAQSREIIFSAVREHDLM